VYTGQAATVEMRIISFYDDVLYYVYSVKDFSQVGGLYLCFKLSYLLALGVLLMFPGYGFSEFVCRKLRIKGKINGI